MTEAIKAYVGVDWASATHQVCVLDAEGRLLGERAFPHDGQGLAAMAAWISAIAVVEVREIAVGIEVPHGPVVETLMERGFAVHAINPKARPLSRPLQHVGRKGRPARCARSRRRFAYRQALLPAARAGR